MAPTPPVEAVERLGDWTMGVAFPTARESLTLLATPTHLLAIGGWNREARALSDVVGLRQASPDATWISAAALPAPSQHHSCVVADGAAWLVGGDTGFRGAVSLSICRSPQDTQTGLGAWTVVADLPEPRTLHAVVVAGDDIFVLGGASTFDATTELTKSVTSIRTTAGGAPHVACAGELPAPFGWGAAVVSRRRVYVVGGLVEFGGQRASEAVWSAAIGETGQLVDWRREADLPSPRYRHAVVPIRDAIVVRGGLGPSGPLSDVLVGRLDAEARIREWEAGPALPATRFAHGAVALDDAVLVAGGFERPNAAFETTADVFVSPLLRR